MTNTKNILIAERYVDALMGLTGSGDLTQAEISKQLEIVKETLFQSADLKAVMENPIISIEKKKEIIDSIFSSELNVLILNFLKVLVEQNRFYAFDDIFDVFKSSVDKLNNIKRVEVVSAVDMSEDAKNRLKSKLESKLQASVILEMQVDAGIIAGLVIKMEDNVIDMSLRHKLEDLSKNIVK